MTNRVDKLAERKLVRRVTDSGDRRAVIVSLTPRGRRVIDAAIQLRMGSADRSLAGLSARERRQLANLLRKVWLAGARA
jgi:DNA-binding MarR family transcriptional regulator